MECTYFWGGKGGELGIFKHVPQILLGLVMLLGLAAESTLKRIFASILACQNCTKQNTQAYLIAPRFRCSGTKLPGKIKGTSFHLFEAECHILGQTISHPTPLFLALCLLFQ